MEITLTETDESFENYKPGYYIFDNRLFSGDCECCGKPFTTHLELSRFCSHECLRSYLDNSLRTGRKHGV